MWDASNWYAIGGGGTFLKTTDAGATWFVNKWINSGGSTNSNYFMYDAHFFDMNTGVAVGGGDGIVRTTDGGTTWTSVDPLPSSTSNFYDVFFFFIHTGNHFKLFKKLSINDLFAGNSCGFVENHFIN